MPLESPYPVIMDMFRHIELCELICVLGYLCFATKKETHLTQATLCSMAIALAIDIFWLQGHKNGGLWLALNVPFLIYLYEKLFRKYALGVYRLMLAVCIRYGVLE